MAHSPNGEIYAYIVGDEEAAVGDIGKVVYYLQRMNGSTAVFEPLKTRRAPLWSAAGLYRHLSKPMALSCFMIVMPEYLKNTFGADEHDGMFLAVINDESDSQPYLRIGHYQGAGRVHRQSGLNYLANREVLNNFGTRSIPIAITMGFQTITTNSQKTPKSNLTRTKTV